MSVARWFAVGVIAWLAGLLAGPILPGVLAGPLYAGASLICHQIAERSFHLGGAQLPVCARCIGIYGGLACGAAVASLRWVPVTPVLQAAADSTRTATVLAAGGAAPTLIMVVGEWAGLWETSNVARAIAGAPLGIVVGLVVLAALDISSGEP